VLQKYEIIHKMCKENKDKKAGSGNKGLYTIAPLLIEEANLLPIQIQLVSEGKLKKLDCSGSSNLIG
jgi:hypothetical protein